MERINFDYSLKNIPIPSNQSYLKTMIEKVEAFIKRIRWKAYFFESYNNESSQNDQDSSSTNFGFKSQATPPQNKHLNAFENDLYEMVRSIEFRHASNVFQKQLATDIKKINETKSLIISADKTTNKYNMSVDDYNKLLTENISSAYRKSNEEVVQSINDEAKSIAKNLKIDDRVQQFSRRNSYITIKDHKENFPNTIKCRLINPAKSEIGIVSKHYLENINKNIRLKSQVNQWRNTSSVISWFKNIPSKEQSKFIKFDIVDFYPSITEELLLKSLDYAKSIDAIDDNVIKVIMHSRRSLLFDKDTVWVKKQNSNFDVTMGSYDGAELCELTGLYILHILGNELGKENLGLYRDDGLGCFQNLSGPESERIKKKICSIFQNCGLKITIETNLVVTDFLDVTFNLKNGKYYPYRKPNNEPLYIHHLSNHPKNIIKEIPKMIEKRISEISCDKDEFDKAKHDYNKALEKSGFKEKIEFQEQPQNRSRRQRKIIWFNPPYSSNVKSNIGKIFMKLIRKHFPKEHKFHKIFNKNTIKLSYSCMPNMESIITKHNNKILNKKTESHERSCNCRDKANCPMNGNCLKKCLVYKAQVSSIVETKYYLGTAEDTFKTRYNNHKKSFKHRMYEKETELSKYIWSLKDKNINFTIKWNVEARAIPYTCGSKRCDLCLTEKLLIAKADPKTLLNKRSEIISKCRHRNKFTLKRFR